MRHKYAPAFTVAVPLAVITGATAVPTSVVTALAGAALVTALTDAALASALAIATAAAFANPCKTDIAVAITGLAIAATVTRTSTALLTAVSPGHLAADFLTLATTAKNHFLAATALTSSPVRARAWCMPPERLELLLRLQLLPSACVVFSVPQ